MAPLATGRRALRGLLPILGLVALSLTHFCSVPAWAQAPTLALPPDTRARLAGAASTPGVEPWQRDLMLRLARGGDAAAVGPTAGGTRAALPWRAADASDGTWTKLTIPARSSHSAIYDPLRDRLVVFGGYGEPGPLDDVWTLTLAGTPAWTKMAPAGVSPGPRPGHSAIYDPVRDRMVVFGGAGTHDLWALALAGTPAWTALTPTGTPPSGREFQSAVYDPVRDRMVVYAGAGTNDVWALELAGASAWTPLDPSGTPPSTREGCSAIYDPAGDRMVVFGGAAGSVRNDAWALSLAGTPAWTALAPAGTLPGARMNHSAVYDPVRHRMVVFGGYGSGLLEDTWVLSLAETPAWTALGTPLHGRAFASVIHDPVRQRMIVFGGWDAAGLHDDVWALSLTGAPAWAELTPAGTAPSAREYHSAIYDPVRDRMVVFGGWDGALRKDVWALSLAGTPAWTQLTPPGQAPYARDQHSAIYDPVRDRMLVFGGWDGWSFHNDVWELTLGETPAWDMLVPSGTFPKARRGHSAVYDATRDRMVIFGGAVAYHGWPPTYFYYTNDVWSLALAGTPAWTQLVPTGIAAPSQRELHSAVFDPGHDRMVVFAGNSGENDVWELSLGDTSAWRQMTPAGAQPGARYGHETIFDPATGRMIVFGGGYRVLYNDVWSLTLGSPFTDVRNPGTPAAGDFRPPIPNPSRGTTTLSYSIARAGRVRLGVYDASGRLVRTLVDGERHAGTGTVTWDGTAASGVRQGAGVYFVRLTGPGLRATRRLVLAR